MMQKDQKHTEAIGANEIGISGRKTSIPAVETHTLISLE